MAGGAQHDAVTGCGQQVRPHGHRLDMVQLNSHHRPARMQPQRVWAQHLAALQPIPELAIFPLAAQSPVRPDRLRARSDHRWPMLGCCGGHKCRAAPGGSRRRPKEEKKPCLARPCAARVGGVFYGADPATRWPARLRVGDPSSPSDSAWGPPPGRRPRSTRTRRSGSSGARTRRGPGKRWPAPCRSAECRASRAAAVQSRSASDPCRSIE